MPQAADVHTTIVMVPRDRYGFTRKSLESLFAHTLGPLELVVTSAAPANLRVWLDSEAATQVSPIWLSRRNSPRTRRATAARRSRARAISPSWTMT